MFGRGKTNLLQRALAKYAGDDVLAGVLRDGEAFLKPHARTVELTLLFFDIARAEGPPGGMDPVALGNYAVKYNEAATNAVRRTNGTFDTFFGDSGSAWWGAQGETDHADRAVECASELAKTTTNLNATIDRSLEPMIWLKIGVHTGLMSLGNFGSLTRLRFTVMGDAVNLAARLCSAAPDYSQTILISGVTFDRLRDKSQTTSLGRILVKGKPDAMDVYGVAF